MRRQTAAVGAMLLLGWCTAGCSSRPPGPIEPPPIAALLRITIGTEITPAVADRIEAAVEEAAAGPSPPALLLHLDSTGGNFPAARRIAEAVKAAPRSVAVVGGGARCASSCTLIWAAAQERLVGATALFGFHGVDCGHTLFCAIRRSALNAYMREVITGASPALVAWLDRQDPPAFARYGKGENNVVRVTGEQIALLRAARLIAGDEVPSPSAVTVRSSGVVPGLWIERLDPLDAPVRHAEPAAEAHPQLGS